MFSKLQYISQGTNAKEQLKNIREALDAGCKWIQLRLKNTEEDEIKIVGEEVKKICASYDSIFIINDHPQIAKAINADGVHLGLTDMKINEARKIVGNDKIIGGTANTLQDVLQRVHEGCNYVGLGPFRFTTTKEKLSPVLGVEGYKKIMNELEQMKISIPVYAIGGIKEEEDISLLMQTGIYGIAVSGVITNHSDKKSLIKKINSLLNEQLNYC